MSDRIRGVLKRAGFAGEPVEFVLGTGTIDELLGGDVEVVITIIGDDARLVCYAGGDDIVNFVRHDGAIVLGDVLWLMESHDGEPESMSEDTAAKLAQNMTDRAPFPVRQDRAS